MAFPTDDVLARSVVDPGDAARFAHFRRKVEAGGEVKIAFLGGSITAGARAVDAAHRYSTLVCRALAKNHPRSSFTEINAGIGATGSRFGASRIGYDVLAAHPDLIVIEFAVNDDLSDTLQSRQTFEGLVRRCVAASDSAAILIFQTMNKNGDSLNQEIQARIGKHYGVPVISYRAACRPLIESKRLAWEDIAADDVHPNDSGHAICASLISSFLSKELSGNGGNGRMGLMPEPLYSDEYQFSDLFHVGDSTLRIVSDSGWTVSQDGMGRITLTSKNKGDRLVLQSGAREITWAYHYAVDVDANVSVKVDDALAGNLSNHFAEDWGGGYLRLEKLAGGTTGSGNRIELRNETGGSFELTYTLYAP